MKKFTKKIMDEKIQKLESIAEEFQELSEEILCQWIEHETQKKYTNFFDFLDNHKYYDGSTHPKIKLPENMNSYLSSSINALIKSPSLFELVFTIEYGLTEYFKEKVFDYYSTEFRKLRLEVFLRDGEVCAKCKKIPGPGISLTVDHIKPVSKFPELALDKNNLQVLCWDCNQNKSNHHYTDYRK